MFGLIDCTFLFILKGEHTTYLSLNESRQIPGKTRILGLSLSQEKVRNEAKIHLHNLSSNAIDRLKVNNCGIN